MGIYFTSKTDTASVPKGELCYANNPDSLFRKYRHLVTEFANHGAGADFLHLPREEYHLILPNGFQLREGNNYYLEVTTRPVLAYRLYPALVGLDNCLEYIESAEDAMKFLFSATGVSREIHPLEYAFMADSSTFNPNANPETTSVDGYVYASNENWNTLRSASSGNALDSGTTFGTYSGIKSSIYNIARGFTLFDTSALGSSVGITSSTIALYAEANPQGYVCLVTSTPASNTGLISDDFDQVGSSEMADRVLMGGIEGTKTWTLSTTGMAQISKTGITKFGFRFEKDFDNVAPTTDTSSEPRFRAADYGSSKPTLTVNYTTTSTSTTTTSTSTSTTTSSSTSSSTTTTSTSTTTTITTSTSTSTTTTSTSTSTTTTSTSTTTTSTSSSTTTVTVPREFVIDNPAS